MCSARRGINAIADGLSDLMYFLSSDDGALRTDERELRDAVGLEKRESSS